MRKKIKIVLWLLLIVGILYSVIATYVRIVEKGDYIVRYNIPCDPSSQECFSQQTCDDSGNNCETTYYSSMQRIESNLAHVCGSDSDISTCVLASKCMQGEAGCSIKLCDPGKDTCSNSQTNNN
jgi:hypothetical protein